MSGVNGAARHDRAVHQAHVVAAAVADNLQLVLPLDQRVVNLPVALRFALEHGIADALAVEIHRRALRLLRGPRRGAARSPAPLRIRSGSAATAATQRRLILLVRVGDRVLVFDDLRVLRTVPLVELHLLPLQIGQPRAEALHRSTFELTAGASASCAGEQRLDLVVHRFFLDALGARPRVLVVHLREVGDHRVLPVFERQRVVRLAILRHRALAVFDLRLLLLDFVGEELQALRRRLGAPLEVLLHVLFDERVGRFRRKRGIGRLHRHVVEPAAAHRIDGDRAEEIVDERVGVSSWRAPMEASEVRRR